MSKRETIGFAQGGIIGMVVVGLLAVLVTWLTGRPAQAAPPVPSSPAFLC